MKNYWIVLIAGLMMFTSCNKDEAEQLESVLGSWKLVSGFIENVSHINVSEDEFAFYMIEDGFKQTESYLGIQVTDESIFIGPAGSLSEFKYTIIDGELRIEASDIGDAGVFVRDNTFNPEVWLTYVAPSSGFELPEGLDAYDIGYFVPDNVFYCASRYGDRKLYKISFAGEIIDSTELDFRSAAVEPSTFGLLMSKGGSDEKIYIIDPDTGADIEESLEIGTFISGIAYEEGTNNIYVASSGDRKVFNYNFPIGGTESLTEVGELPFSPEGMHFYNGHLYILSSSKIYKMSMPSFTVAETFNVVLSQGESLKGITRDADKFWLSTSIYETDQFFFKPVYADL